MNSLTIFKYCHSYMCNYDLQCESKTKAEKRKFPRRELNQKRGGESAEFLTTRPREKCASVLTVLVTGQSSGLGLMGKPPCP